MFKHTTRGKKGHIRNADVCAYSMSDLSSISHMIHRFYTYTAQKIQYICTCFCTTHCDTLSMEKQMSCAIWYRTSVFAL